MEKINFKELVKPYEKEALQTLKDIVKIKSVYDEKTISKDMPYGYDVNNALVFMKNLALSKGFNASIVGNRCVEITCGTKGTEVGVFGHLDVVPITEGWEHDPLNVSVDKDIIYGRGVADDKGPVIAAFYSLVALKENNLLSNYKVRFVCGGDEERGSSCLYYYFNEAKKPDVDTGFTPDSDFPLIYAEKGIINYVLKGNIDLGKNIISLNAGLASNVVISKAVAEVANPKEFEEYLVNKNINYTIKGNFITFIGKAAHGSTPEEGKNSGIIMLKCLGEFYDNNILSMLALQYEDYNGRNIKQYFYGETLKETTYNVGLISYDGHTFSMTVNFRFPENVNGKHVVESIQNISPLPIYMGEESKVLYFDPKCKLIKTLTEVYQEETNDLTTRPLAIGGGTYAKEAKNIVAFGPTFPGRNYRIHDCDEHIELSDFNACLYIYAHAIYKLGNN